MERYSYLQSMPNSPLTPLTPLSENTQFEFNFGGDGSLDEYIDSVRQEHRVEQQRSKLLKQANVTFKTKNRPPLPRRYSEEFLKIREVFEDSKHECKELNCNQAIKLESIISRTKTPKVKIIYSLTTPEGTIKKETSALDYESTPTNVRTPLKLKNNNVAQNLTTNIFNKQRKLKFQQKKILQQKQQHLQTNPNKRFLQASPVAAKPLCPQLANILQQCRLSTYCGIFQREEIDLMAFQLLGHEDLHDLGIKNQNHCAILMKNIQYVRRHMYMNDF